MSTVAHDKTTTVAPTTRATGVPSPSGLPCAARWIKSARRAAGVGFLFFLLKGLAWLALGAAAAVPRLAGYVRVRGAYRREGSTDLHHED